VLTNAVKYSSVGSTIAVGLECAGGRLRCIITDQGIDIRLDDLDRIFTLLYRSDTLAHRDIDGTGLGLSIVAKADALLDIKLEVTNELGQDTTFTQLFPA